MEIKELISECSKSDQFTSKIDQNKEVNRVKYSTMSNVVSKEKLREVQYLTLDNIANALRNTFGPMGSNTVILSGSDKDTLVADYSKDGHKVLKHILYSNPIELSIQTQLVDITSHVEKVVGDGTTSAVMLSNEIFKKLCDYSDKDIAPYRINRAFSKVVKSIQNKIKSNGRDFTLDDVYDIAYISTNGNTEIATMLKDLYSQYGLDVYIDTTISNTEHNQIKIMDGLTLEEGYSDTAYVNTSDGTSSIRNPRIYSFLDPVDTPEMVSLFEKILAENIMIPAANGELDECIPTVILSPKLSRDMSDLIGKLCDYLYTFDSQNMASQKPPILIVTNLNTDQDKYLDLARLCGCKMIRKYVDPELQKKDIEKGVAPTLDTICDFYGSSELIVSDISGTKVINPKEMFTGDEDEEGNPIHTATYDNLIKFLEAELENSIKNNEGTVEIYRLKKRIQSLKANMIELQIGGITISDRDSLKDLVEDAVKNCRSASENGVGYAANFEGFRAAIDTYNETVTDDLENDMIKIIVGAYTNVLKSLYNTVYSSEVSEKIVIDSYGNSCPLNLVTEKYDRKVITSINTDIEILEAISKIISIMYTSNQALVQVPALNKYI